MSSRRSALHAIASILSFGIAGCTSPAQQSDTPTSTQTTSSISTNTPSPTHTESPTPTTAHNPSLSFSAQVVQQASTESPPQIEASLTNTGSTTTFVGFGPALLFSDDTAELEWATDIVLDPKTTVGSSVEPIQTEDGCWRVPIDKEILIQSTLEWREISPDESLNESYRVYTRGEQSPCLPAGTYRFQDVINTEADEMVLTLVLEIDSEKHISIASATAETPTDSTTSLDY